MDTSELDIKAAPPGISVIARQTPRGQLLTSLAWLSKDDWVLVIEQESQSKKQYTLVGQDEADMKFNRISVQSPVGRALIGKRVGDFIEVTTPAKVMEYEIVEIKFEEL